MPFGQALRRRWNDGDSSRFQNHNQAWHVRFSPYLFFSESNAARVVTNELRSEGQDHSHWTFRLETSKKDGQQEVCEVIETKNGDLKVPVMINDHEITAKQREESVRRLQQLVHNPEALRKSAKDKNQDAARSQQLLGMLPDAFIFNLAERREKLQQLVFKPNPRFHPRNREAEVFHRMEGTVWVDDKGEQVGGNLGASHRRGKICRDALANRRQILPRL